MDAVKTGLPAEARGLRYRPLLRPFIFGGLATLGLLAFYLGTITLAQGWEHAAQQLADDRWFVSAIIAGFGTQVGLYAYLRGMQTHARAGGVAASTGTSTVAMLACCAHHLTDVFAIFGLSGAAIFLNAYKTPLLWLGIVMNLFGIAYLPWHTARSSRNRRSGSCCLATWWYAPSMMVAASR